MRGQSFCAKQEFDALSWRGCHLFQSVICDDTIVVFQWHYVCNGGYGGDVKILLYLFSACHGFNQFQCNSCTAEIVKAISFHLGVDDYAVGQNILRLVVVGDDDVNAFPFQIFHFLTGGDATVNGDDKVGTTAGNQALQGVHVHTIAVCDTVGDEIFDVKFVTEIQHQNGYCAYAVTVVVAKDEHLFSIQDCPFDPL